MRVRPRRPGGPAGRLAGRGPSPGAGAHGHLPGPAGADAIRCDVLVELGQARRSGGMIAGSARARSMNRSAWPTGSATKTACLPRPLRSAPRHCGGRASGVRPTTASSRCSNGSWTASATAIPPAASASSPPSPRAVLRRDGHPRMGKANEALGSRGGSAGPKSSLSPSAPTCSRRGRITDHLPQIRAILDEMLQGRRPDLTPLGRRCMLATCLPNGSAPGDRPFRRRVHAAWALAADVLHSPEVQVALRWVEACRYFVRRGPRARRRPLRGCTFPTSLHLIGPTPRDRVGSVMDSCRMLLTGTVADHAEQLAARLARPDHPSIPHLAAPAAALGFAQRGDIERARQIASRWFAPPPRSWTWMQAIAYWAQVATRLGPPTQPGCTTGSRRTRASSPSSGWSATAAAPSTACWPGSPGGWAARRSRRTCPGRPGAGDPGWLPDMDQPDQDLINRISTDRATRQQQPAIDGPHRLHAGRPVGRPAGNHSARYPRRSRQPGLCTTSGSGARPRRTAGGRASRAGSAVGRPGSPGRSCRPPCSPRGTRGCRGRRPGHRSTSGRCRCRGRRRRPSSPWWPGRGRSGRWPAQRSVLGVGDDQRDGGLPSPAMWPAAAPHRAQLGQLVTVGDDDEVPPLPVRRRRRPASRWRCARRSTPGDRLGRCTGARSGAPTASEVRQDTWS